MTVMSSGAWTAAKWIDPGGVLAYAKRRGWSVGPSRWPDYALVSAHVEGSPVTAEFLLPATADKADVRQRIADALVSLAAVEGRSETAVATDILAGAEPTLTPAPAPGRRPARRRSTRR